MTGSHLSQPTDNLAQVARCASRISSALGIGPPVLDAVHQTRSRFWRTCIVSVQLAAPPSMKAVRTTVDLWLARYAELGVAGLLDRPRGAGHEQVPARIRSRVLALSRQSPPLAEPVNLYETAVRTIYWVELA